MLDLGGKLEKFLIFFVFCVSWRFWFLGLLGGVSGGGVAGEVSLACFFGLGMVWVGNFGFSVWVIFGAFF